MLIEALDQVKRSHLQLPLSCHWYGSSQGAEETKRTWQSLIEQKELSQELQLHDVAENVSSLLGDSTCLLHPSQREGMSNVVLEAMASKCFVIASQAGESSKLISHGESGLLFDAHDPTELKDCIQIYLSLSEEQRWAYASRARERLLKSVSNDDYLSSYLCLHEKRMSRC